MGSGLFAKAKFCPWCGTDTLVRDRFQAEGYSDKTASFICAVCHKGFTMRESPRVHFANRMFQEERAQRPPDNEHVAFTKTKPLAERSMFELQRVEGILKGKRPRTKTGREANARNLKAIQDEIARRGMRSSTLTFTIGDVFPSGCLPPPYNQD